MAWRLGSVHGLVGTLGAVALAVGCANAEDEIGDSFFGAGGSPPVGGAANGGAAAPTGGETPGGATAVGGVPAGTGGDDAGTGGIDPSTGGVNPGTGGSTGGPLDPGPACTNEDQTHCSTWASGAHCIDDFCSCGEMQGNCNGVCVHEMSQDKCW